MRRGDRGADPDDENGPEDSAPMDDTERSIRNLLDSQDGHRPGMLPELIRRMMTMGFAGLFTTESAIRAALGDTVPREWVEFVADQSERTRNEFINRLSQEFARVLENVDVVDLAEQLLEGRTIEVKAEFRLLPRADDGSAKPAKKRTRARKHGDADAGG